MSSLSAFDNNQTLELSSCIYWVLDNTHFTKERISDGFVGGNTSMVEQLILILR